jgi:hypothetical protein
MEEPGRTGSRLVDACIGVFVASVALYGAVKLIQAVWVWLAVLIFIGAALAGITWVILARFRRW